MIWTAQMHFKVDSWMLEGRLQCNEQRMVHLERDHHTEGSPLCSYTDRDQPAKRLSLKTQLADLWRFTI